MPNGKPYPPHSRCDDTDAARLAAADARIAAVDPRLIGPVGEAARRAAITAANRLLALITGVAT